jgi:hypothetical protein
VVGFLFVATACAAQKSVIETGPDGLRTFSIVTERDGVLVTCGAMAVEPHVTGSLAGDPAGREPVWVVGPNEVRWSVVWPAGFHVTFAPEALLHDPTGAVVAREGDTVELNQVSPGAASGTYQDPYIAACWLFGATYPYLP